MGTAPTYWQIAQYRSMGADGSGDFVFDRILSTGNVSPSIASELSGNRRYKFELGAHVTQSYGELGDVVFKTITVDLRGL